MAVTSSLSKEKMKNIWRIVAQSPVYSISLTIKTFKHLRIILGLWVRFLSQFILTLKVYEFEEYVEL